MNNGSRAIATKVEDNPVFQDQVRKRKTMLCAAFAAAACSAGVLFSVAKESPDKLAAAGLVTSMAGYMATPMARRRRRMADDPLFRNACTAYGPTHPYQVLVTKALQGVAAHKDAKVYRCDHESVASVAFTDTRDIYFDAEFENRINSEEHMEAITAHEVGHMQDSDGVRSFGLLSSNLAGMTGIAVPVMIALTPIAPLMIIPFAAVTVGSIVATHLALSYVARRTEHIADIRSMYNIASKTVSQDAIFNSFHSYKQLALEDHAVESLKREARGEMPLPPLGLVGDNYSSRFVSHPNPHERRAVMDEAAKYMPG